jgi:hypothetical protein
VALFDGSVGVTRLPTCGGWKEYDLCALLEARGAVHPELHALVRAASDAAALETLQQHGHGHAHGTHTRQASTRGGGYTREGAHRPSVGGERLADGRRGMETNVIRRAATSSSTALAPRRWCDLVMCLTWSSYSRSRSRWHSCSQFLLPHDPPSHRHYVSHGCSVWPAFCRTDDRDGADDGRAIAWVGWVVDGRVASYAKCWLVLRSRSIRLVSFISPSSVCNGRGATPHARVATRQLPSGHWTSERGLPSRDCGDGAGTAGPCGEMWPWLVPLVIMRR